MCKSHHKDNEQASSLNASTPLSTSTEIDIVTSHRSVCKMNHLLPVALVRCLPLNCDIQIPSCPSICQAWHGCLWRSLGRTRCCSKLVRKPWAASTANFLISLISDRERTKFCLEIWAEDVRILKVKRVFIKNLYVAFFRRICCIEEGVISWFNWPGLRLRFFKFSHGEIVEFLPHLDGGWWSALSQHHTQRISTKRVFGSESSLHFKFFQGWWWFQSCRDSCIHPSPHPQFLSHRTYEELMVGQPGSIVKFRTEPPCKTQYIGIPFQWSLKNTNQPTNQPLEVETPPNASPSQFTSYTMRWHKPTLSFQRGSKCYFPEVSFYSTNG